MTKSNEDRNAMTLALSALHMSSPHTDAQHRWKDPAWKKQRSEAIQALQAQLFPPDTATEPSARAET